MFRQFLLLVLALCCPIVLAKPPIVPLTNQSIAGQYYFSHERYIRDAYITTPINGKFYFHFFIAQTPSYGAMVVQYYNEIDGVASFDKNGVAHFTSPYKNCQLTFLFQSVNLLVDQAGSCGMSADIGMEIRGIYTQLEAF